VAESRAATGSTCAWQDVRVCPFMGPGLVAGASAGVPLTWTQGADEELAVLHLVVHHEAARGKQAHMDRDMYSERLVTQACTRVTSATGMLRAERERRAESWGHFLCERGRRQGGVWQHSGSAGCR